MCFFSAPVYVVISYVVGEAVCMVFVTVTKEKLVMDEKIAAALL